MKMAAMELEGDVQTAKVAAGSKSERMAVTLQTPGGKRYVLQSQDGSVFGIDQALQEMVGHRIHALGIAADQTFIVRKWDFLD